MTIDRDRVVYAIASLVVIAIGLTTRLPIVEWPASVGKYAGSVLWGAMVYFTFRFLYPAARVAVTAAVAMIIAALVEFSQLWHPGWLDAFRRTTIGVLLIGRYFSWTDIVAYTAGIACAALADRLSTRG